MEAHGWIARGTVSIQELAANSGSSWISTVMLRIDPNWMHTNINKLHKVSPCSSPHLQRHSCLGTETSDVTKCPPNVALQVKMNSCIYPKLKVTLTLVLEIGSKGLGHVRLTLFSNKNTWSDD